MKWNFWGNCKHCHNTISRFRHKIIATFCMEIMKSNHDNQKSRMPRLMIKYYVDEYYFHFKIDLFSTIKNTNMKSDT